MRRLTLNQLPADEVASWRSVIKLLLINAGQGPGARRADASAGGLSVQELLQHALPNEGFVSIGIAQLPLPLLVKWWE